MFLQKFILISLLIALPNEVVSDIIIDFPEITEEDLIRKPNNPWALQMVQNIFWDRSKSYMGIIRTKIVDEPEFHLGKTPESAHDSRGLPYERGLWEDGEMSYFVGMNQPNMLINFTTTDDDTAFCHIGIIPDEVLDLVLEEYKVYGDKYCIYERKPYSMDSPHENFIQTKKKYAFCSLDEFIKEKLPSSEVPTWILANGTYHRPSKTPECLYDFHHIAKDTNEYNFFSYCARAYWYNGRNYNDQDERVKKLRKDWFMYMFEGKVTCSQTDRLQENMDMLKKGYRIELVHHYDFYSYRFFDQMYYCPQLRAKLAKYEDNRQDGRFFFAGIVGAGQLENFILRSYWGHTNNKTNNWHVEPKKFWDKETYTKLYKEMDLDLKACYLHYHNLGRRYRTIISNYTNEGERINPETPSQYYNIQLRVVHFCTDRGMRENLAFDIKMRPDQVPEGIFEDNDLEIDLTNKRLIRPTGQTFCAYGQKDCRKKKPTELPPEPRSADGVNNVRKEGELAKNAECETANQYPRSRDCPFASICIDKELRCKFGPLGIQKQDPICRQQTAEQGYFDNLVNIFNSAQNSYDRPFKCQETALPAKKDGEDCQGIDRLCRENAFCARIGINKTTETKSECRQLRARELGETCYITDECMPGAICERKPGERELWAKCVNAKRYQCPNRGYRTPCFVDKCQRGMEKSRTCSPTYGEFVYLKCAKSTSQGFEWNAWTCGAPRDENAGVFSWTTIKRIFGALDRFLFDCEWLVQAFKNVLNGKPPPNFIQHNALKCIEAYSEAATHHCCS